MQDGWIQVIQQAERYIGMKRFRGIFAGLSVAAASSAFATSPTIMPMAALHSVQLPPLTINTYPAPPVKGYDPNQAHAAPESDAARRDLNLAVQNLRHEFETSQDYTSALSAATDARSAYQKAMQDALRQLRDSPEYKTQQLEVAQAEEAVEDARRKSNDFTDVIAAANRASAARQAIGKMEADALAADFAFTATKQIYLDAAAHVVALREQFNSSLAGTAEFRAAKDKLDAATNVK